MSFSIAASILVAASSFFTASFSKRRIVLLCAFRILAVELQIKSVNANLFLLDLIRPGRSERVTYAQVFKGFSRTTIPTATYHEALEYDFIIIRVGGISP